MKCRAQPHPKHRMISNGDTIERTPSLHPIHHATHWHVCHHCGGSQTSYWHRMDIVLTTWWLLEVCGSYVNAWEGRCPGRISIGRIWVGLTAEGPSIAVASELLHFQLRNQRLMSTSVDQCRPVLTGNIYPCTIGAIHLCIIQISFNLCMSHWMPLSINAPSSLTKTVR